MGSENHSELQILYIGGYGRSGSTLIERILATDTRILGGGEIANLLPMLLYPEKQSTPLPKCSCGANLEDCKVWGPLVQDLLTLSRKRLLDYLISQRIVESLSVYIFQKSRKPKFVGLYEEFTQKVFRHLFSLGINVVIDSSKTSRLCAFRPLALARWSGYKVRLLHLVRDGRGCILSNLRGDNIKMERGLSNVRRPAALVRTTLSWIIANWAARRFGKSFPEAYTVLRFEDFIREPRKTLENLARFLDLDLIEPLNVLTRMQYEEIEVPQTHQISGNRLRFESRLRLSPPKNWRELLPSLYQWFFWALAGWEAKRYGYHH